MTKTDANQVNIMWVERVDKVDRRCGKPERSTQKEKEDKHFEMCYRAHREGEVAQHQYHCYIVVALTHKKVLHFSYSVKPFPNAS